jgi:hypothetical protein
MARPIAKRRAGAIRPDNLGVDGMAPRFPVAETQMNVQSRSPDFPRMSGVVTSDRAALVTL